MVDFPTASETKRETLKVQEQKRAERWKKLLDETLVQILTARSDGQMDVLIEGISQEFREDLPKALPSDYQISWPVGEWPRGSTMRISWRHATVVDAMHEANCRASLAEECQSKTRS